MGRKIKVIKIQDYALLRLRELKEKHKKNYFLALDCSYYSYELHKSKNKLFSRI